jgi:hypothetical protein
MEKQLGLTVRKCSLANIRSPSRLMESGMLRRMTIRGFPGIVAILLTGWSFAGCPGGTPDETIDDAGVDAADAGGVDGDGVDVEPGTCGFENIPVPSDERNPVPSGNGDRR